MKYERQFSKIQIGNVEIPNRYAMAPMGPLGLGDCEGGWNQKGIDYYTRRAKGGIGLIITGVTFSDTEIEKPSFPNTPNGTYTYDYDPMDPTPCRSGIVISPGDSLRQSKEDAEKRTDVLVYSSEVLAEDVTVVGPVEANLWASSSAVDTDFTAKLVDVRPDGSTYNVTEGIVRARLRDGLDKEQLLIPSAIYQFRINMSATGLVFKAGHRIRVEISSSNFPKHDRNMNTGNAVGEDAIGVVAHQTIFHDAEHPSHITLPLVSL